MSLRALRIAGLLVAAAAPARGQGVDTAQVVWIEVRDVASKSPVLGARVRAVGDSSLRTLTDSSGMASLGLRRDRRVIVTTRLGFRPDTTEVSNDAWAAGLVSVSLIPIAQTLTEVAVEGVNPAISPMMAEFEARRARHSGGATYIGPEEFERRPSARLTDFFRGRSGVTLHDSSGVIMPVSSRGPVIRVNQNRRIGPGRDAVERVQCVLRVAVNGNPMEWGFDLNLLDPKEVYGVEIYAGPATVPVQYQTMARDGYCGLILVWTRAR